MLLQMQRQRRQFSERACSTKLLDERSGEGGGGRRRRPTLIATYERPPPSLLFSILMPRDESVACHWLLDVYSNGPEQVSFCFSIPAAFSSIKVATFRSSSCFRRTQTLQYVPRSFQASLKSFSSTSFCSTGPHIPPSLPPSLPPPPFPFASVFD